MKKAYLLIALACVTAYSCTKHYSTYNNHDSRDTTGFVVKGIADMTLESRDSITMPIVIERVSGQEQKLTISASGLPANVTATFSPASGYNFATTLTLVAKKAALGNYDFKINISDSSSDIIRSYDVNLTVGPKMFCTEEILGDYMADYMCTSDTDSVASFIFPVTTSTGTSKDMVSISGLLPVFPGIAVDVTLTCEGQKIMMANQDAGPFKVWGEGDFATDGMVMIDYHYFDGADTINCTAKLTRKP